MTDAAGSAYLVGQTTRALEGNTHSGSYDFFVAKYVAAGTRQWMAQSGTSSSDIAHGIAIDASGALYLTGSTLGGLANNTNAGSYDLFLMRFDSEQPN